MTSENTSNQEGGATTETETTTETVTTETTVEGVESTPAPATVEGGVVDAQTTGTGVPAPKETPFE